MKIERQHSEATYEGNPAARAKCLAHHGHSSSVCLFDFGKIDGEIGEGVIHVHHLKVVSSVGKKYDRRH